MCSLPPGCNNAHRTCSQPFPRLLLSFAFDFRPLLDVASLHLFSKTTVFSNRATISKHAHDAAFASFTHAKRSRETLCVRLNQLASPVHSRARQSKKNPAPLRRSAVGGCRCCCHHRGVCVNPHSVEFLFLKPVKREREREKVALLATRRVSSATAGENRDGTTRPRTFSPVSRIFCVGESPISTHHKLRRENHHRSKILLGTMVEAGTYNADNVFAPNAR